LLLQIDWGEGLKETEQESNAEIDFGDIDFNSISLEGISTSDITIEQSVTLTSQGVWHGFTLIIGVALFMCVLGSVQHRHLR